MNIKLERPIVFFDLETTGIQIATDRIVEISVLKVYPNGNKESWTKLVNPEIEIPKEIEVTAWYTPQIPINQEEIYTYLKDIRKIKEKVIMTKINLHGILKYEFGEVIPLNITRTKEIIDAIDTIKKDFRARIYELARENVHFNIIADGESVKDLNQLEMKKNFKQFLIFLPNFLNLLRRSQVSPAN